MQNLRTLSRVDESAAPDRRRIVLIVNPASGTSSKDSITEKVKETFGDALDVRLTEGVGDAARFAREAADDDACMLVIAAGGDGTVNETASALCDTGKPMAIIPCGSGNGLARHIGLTPGDVDGSLAVAKAGWVINMDYGTLNGRPFFCTCGVGFDAAVSDEFARSSGRGLINYLKSTISTIANYRAEEYKISIDDKEISEKAMLVAVANASQYGNNAMIAPKASISDGLLDVTVVRDGNLLQSAIVGLDLMTGHIDRNMLVETYQGRHVVIERPADGLAHVDGEPVEAAALIDIECRAGGLSIVVPIDPI